MSIDSRLTKIEEGVESLLQDRNLLWNIENQIVPEHTKHPSCTVWLSEDGKYMSAPTLVSYLQESCRLLYEIRDELREMNKNVKTTVK